MDSSTLRLRRARPADAALLATLAAKTFTETFGPVNRPEDVAAHLATYYGVVQQARELADDAYFTLLMETDEGFAAYAQVRRHAPPPCVTGPAPIELYRLYV